MTVLNCDLSFDPRDPYFDIPGIPGIQFAVQVFTTDNGYGLDAETTLLEPHPTPVLHATKLARLGQQQTAPGAVNVRLTVENESVTFHIAVHHSDPIKSVKLLLTGLPTTRWWSPTTPTSELVDSPFQWNYPGQEWATRWAASGGATLSVDDDLVQGGILHVDQPRYAPAGIVEYVHSVRADHWSSDVTIPPIRLTTAGDDTSVRAELKRHHERVISQFSLPERDHRPDSPAWLDDIDLVVTLHGQHWTGYVFNDFARMTDILHRIANVADPTRVLAYLPGWEGRYYHSYPHYLPGQDLGGEAGFDRLCRKARALGTRTMPMFGANGANIARYPRWQDAAIRNDTNQYPTMLNAPDWDSDRQSEGNQVFLNPGEPVFQAELAAAISRTVDMFGVDAAFLDTASFWFNDPRYPLHEGYLQLVGALHEQHPGLLVAGEGWWDAMTAVFPLSQQWLGVERSIRYPDLLTRHARTTAHLAEGTPGLGSTGVHEQGYRHRPTTSALVGHIPVVSFVDGDTAPQLELIKDLMSTRSPV